MPVTIEGSSDAVPPPDLASLMLTAMSLGAASSHVSQTTREDNTDGRSTITTSTCVSFTFYTPSIVSPYANLRTQANTRPSSPISISSTDADADLSVTDDGLVLVNEDPCVDINLHFQSTVAHTSRAMATPSATVNIHKGGDTGALPSTAPAVVPAAMPADILAATPAAAPAALPDAAVAAAPAAIPAVLSTAAPAVVASAAPAAMTATSGGVRYHAPVGSDDRWYCVTVGRQVGVFQGPTTVQPLVNGVSGACYPRHSSRASAEAAYAIALANGTVQVRV